MKTIHVAEMISQGGRHGSIEKPEGGFRVQLTGEDDSNPLTPEHLFAGAYAACFLSAVENAATTNHMKLNPGTTLTARVHLEEDDQEKYRLNVELRATLPGMNETDARHLLNLAHQSCPYSKATRNNINVSLELD